MSPSPHNQMINEQDIEPECLNAPRHFDIMSHITITITFTPTDRDIKVKDEAALGAIVAPREERGALFFGAAKEHGSAGAY
eukprot:scaffold47859_cov27-Tisochrysis_lutea.AAC.1